MRYLVTGTSSGIGRATALRLAERGHHAMDAFLRFSRKVEEGAGDPGRVAAVIERALTTRNPRRRYLVGSDSRAAIAMERFLPTRTSDALFCRITGIR